MRGRPKKTHRGREIGWPEEDAFDTFDGDNCADILHAALRFDLDHHEDFGACVRQVSIDLVPARGTRQSTAHAAYVRRR